jgi:hypothetical protein
MYPEHSESIATASRGARSSQFANISVCLDDAHALLATRANLLLSGAEAATAQVLRSLRPELRQPVWETSAAPFSLPSTPVGTLIVRRAAGLAAADQVRLLHWVRDHQPQVQVVTITPRPLFPMVMRGSFLETLYYSLNTVYLEL